MCHKQGTLAARSNDATVITQMLTVGDRQPPPMVFSNGRNQGLGSHWHQIWSNQCPPRHDIPLWGVRRFQFHQPVEMTGNQGFRGFPVGCGARGVVKKAGSEDGHGENGWKG